MIRAVIFDLDGTLVQTETIKAASYGEAAVELCPSCANVEEVTNAFKDVVGRSRQEVSQDLMDRFHLESATRKKMSKLNVREPWEAFVETRLRIYEKMLADPQMLRSHQLQHNIDLLHRVHSMSLKTALATTSEREPTNHILEVLGIEDQFDLIATAEDVKKTKPDPEIYLLISYKFDIPPKECLAIEDSPPGVQSALSAGAWCIAVTTPFTMKVIHESGLLDDRWIVDNPDALDSVFRSMLEERSHES